VLSHVKRGLESAYRRGTSLTKRTVAMQAYADWLAGDNRSSEDTADDDSAS
jgi:hypothetical protein